MFVHNKIQLRNEPGRLKSLLHSKRGVFSSTWWWQQIVFLVPFFFIQRARKAVDCFMSRSVTRTAWLPADRLKAFVNKRLSTIPYDVPFKHPLAWPIKPIIPIYFQKLSIKSSTAIVLTKTSRYATVLDIRRTSPKGRAISCHGQTRCHHWLCINIVPIQMGTVQGHIAISRVLENHSTTPNKAFNQVNLVSN